MGEEVSKIRNRIESTWTKGSDLIGGDKELAIILRANEPQAFYRVVVSKTAK